MTETEPDLQSITRLTARELLRLPLSTLTNLLQQAVDETRRAKRREHWLRAIRAMKLRITPPWSDQ